MAFVVMVVCLLYAELGTTTGFVSRSALPSQSRRTMPLGAKRTFVEEIEAMGGRVTAFDVAPICGSTRAAERELIALAARLADDGVCVEAFEDGRLVFDFGHRPSKRLAKIDRGARWSRRWRKLTPHLRNAGVVGFGSFLIASMAFCTIAMVATATAGTAAGDAAASSGVKRQLFSTQVSVLTPLDFFLIDEVTSSMSLYYTYVFGCGDPNRNSRQQELEKAARVVEHFGGIVTAEQLAPILRKPPAIDADPSTHVLPVVFALGGRPELVGDDLFFVFDDHFALSKPNERRRRYKYMPLQPLEEKEIGANVHPDGMILPAALGVLNLLGATALALTVGAPGASAALGQRKFAVLKMACGPLLTYAVVYNVVPILRFLPRKCRNAAIRAREERRLAWAAHWEKEYNDSREEKLAMYRENRRLVIEKKNGEDKVAYSTDQSFQQIFRTDTEENLLAAFDRLLGLKKLIMK